MSFTPIAVTNGTTPLTPRLMRHIETQYQKGKEDAADDIRTSSTEIRTELRTGNPAGPNAGRVYLNTTTGALLGWTGTEWRELR